MYQIIYGFILTVLSVLIYTLLSEVRKELERIRFEVKSMNDTLRQLYSKGYVSEISQVEWDSNEYIAEGGVYFDGSEVSAIYHLECPSCHLDLTEEGKSLTEEDTKDEVLCTRCGWSGRWSDAQIGSLAGDDE